MSKTLLLFSALYLLIEIFFNINFVEIVSKDNLALYPNIDVWGRHVSSIGASLLFIRLLLQIIKKEHDRTIKALALFSIVFFYYGFFVYQEKLINYISASVPYHFKHDVSNAYIYQKGYINSGLNYIDININNSKATEKENQVLKSSLGFWGFGANNFMNVPKEESIRRYNNIFFNDLKHKPEYYKKIYLDSTIKLDKFYMNYERTSQVSSDSAHHVADDAWNDVLEKINLVDNYNSAKRALEKKIKKEKKSYITEAKGHLFMLSKCGSQSCFNTFNKKLKSISKSSVYNFHTSISFEDSCYFTIGNKSSIKYYELKGISERMISSDMKHYINNERQSIRCIVDFREWENIIEKKVKNDFKNKTGVSEWHHKNKEAFINSGALNRTIIDHLKKKEIFLPKNWNISDKDIFYDVVNGNVMKIAQKQFDDEMIEKFGFSIPLKMSKKDFFNHPRIESYFKEKIGIMYVNFNIDPTIDNDYFLTFFGEKFKKEAGYYYFEKLNNDINFVNNLFKINIIPLLSISFSLTFGFLNFLFIVHAVSSKLLNMNKIVSVVFYLFLLSVAVYLPFVSMSYYTNEDFFEVMIKELKLINPLLSYYYQWFLNLETIIFSLFKDFVLFFDFIDGILKK